MKRWSLLLISIVVSVVIFGVIMEINRMRPSVETSRATPEEVKASGACLHCHDRVTPAITKQFRDSSHFKAGVTCLDCHQTAHKDYALQHEGFEIAREVTAGACQRCHVDEYNEFVRSRHGLPAWSAVAGIDDFTPEQIEHAKQFHPGEPTERGPSRLAQIEGMGAAENGCMVCHSIGQPRYDGSIGDCSKCHGRHEFSVAMARTPVTCGSCHMGPDHSQLEIYNESKHGIQFQVRRDKQDLTVKPSELSVQHQDVPTCATCHMSGLEGVGMTHDVGERLSYYLFEPVSEKRPNFIASQQNMKDICLKCHAKTHVDEFYKTAELTIPSTNEKVKKSLRLIRELRDEGLLTPEPFDETIEFLAFNLWHHWGRTIKHGAFMGGADFTQWHGNYELLKDWVEMQALAEELRRKAKEKADHISSDAEPGY